MLTGTLEKTANFTDSAALDNAIDAAKSALLGCQADKGYWCAELQGDSILESEYILFRTILREENDPCLVKVANYLRQIQQADGGWNLYPGGPPDLSGSVKAYFALKLMGDDPDAPHMRAARQLIRRMGGAEKSNSFTRFYFAALGQVSYDACPSVPPEVIYFPKWCYFNLYHLSSWTRAMILPLGLLTCMRAVRELPESKSIKELFLDFEAANRLAKPARGFPTTWRDFFLRVDQLLKAYNEAPLPVLRQDAMRRAEKWILDHFEGSDGVAAIFPSMVYTLMIFHLLGYPEDHPNVIRGHQQLREFFIEENDTIRLQPCLSPVWDTGIALHSLAETEIDPRLPEIESSVQWLLEKECRIGSDWTRNCRNLMPDSYSGWYFEFSNPHYPDVDDTAMVVTSLSRVGGDVAAPAAKRGMKWLLTMQNDDGGWAAFDRTTPRPILEQIPFADHNAMQDPSCPDITGRALEALGHCGLSASHPAVVRAVEFLKREQDACGGWWGRWGVNFVYGTFQVLVGLRAVGVDASADLMRRAADWLRSCQKSDGSWGETPASYDDPALKGAGPSTASQTAWGIMGILAVSGTADPAARRGVEWLVSQQATDGAWNESEYTGTGFPKVFYLKYHLYRLYFPLMALARFKRLSHEE